MVAEGQRIYVYGIVRCAADGGAPDGLPAAGLAGGEVRGIVEDGLTAIASTLDVAAGGMPFQEELSDPERARTLVLDHHRVLQQAIGSQTVLPMRFGVLFEDDRSVAAALKRNRRGLMDALGRVEGAREWGVKIFCDRAKASARLGSTSTVVQVAEGELSQASEGRSFFLRRRLERLRTEEADRALAKEIETGWQSLCDVVRASEILKLQPAAVHERKDEMVRNGTVLVPRREEECFLSQVENLSRSHADLGLRYELTGPWPPFSFVDCQLEGGEDVRPDAA